MALAMGCGKKTSDAEDNTAQKVVGTYQVRLPNGLFTIELQNEGKALMEQVTDAGEKKPEVGTWRMEDGNVVVVAEETSVMKVNPNGDLTVISIIDGGKREEIPEGMQKIMTFKKVK